MLRFQADLAVRTSPARIASGKVQAGQRAGPAATTCQGRSAAGHAESAQWAGPEQEQQKGRSRAGESNVYAVMLVRMMLSEGGC